MKAKSAVPALIKAAAASDTHEAVVEALAKMPDLAALNLYLDGLGSKNASLRTQCETALRGFQNQALPLLEARLTSSDLPPSAVAALKQIYQNDPDAKRSSLIRHKILETPLLQYQEFAVAHTGDARRGRAIFRDLKGVGCIRCHRIDSEGGDIGPDLTGIHSKYPRPFIIESVLYPSKVILDGYQQVSFQTKDDDEISGMVRNETEDEVTVIDSGGVKHVLKKSDITKRKVSQISLMPEGLQSGLTVAEFSDLISYVENPAAADTAKPPSRAAHSPGTPAPELDLSAAPPPPPEPGADLFSFLEVAPLPDAPPRWNPPSGRPPGAGQPPHHGPPPHSQAPPPAPPPPPSTPAPLEAADPSSQLPDAPLPPMPPGMKPPSPAPPE